jgi:MoxR-like ATPase
MSSTLQTLEHRLQEGLGRNVMGLEHVVRAALIALLARGHILLQGPPGLGKTLLSRTLAELLGGEFKRVQGTSDLMPSDITGVQVFDAARSAFVFHPGPIFADILLMDEINRAGPKTQSALLEAMEERHVTIDRHRYALPPNFLVIATQNPHEFEGTYPLPESQLDRFMLRVDMSYPARKDEREILMQYGNIGRAPAALDADVRLDELLAAARSEADAPHVAPGLMDYVLDIAKASREHPQLSLGLSTRGALALLRAARVSAALRGAEFATPDDVKEVVPLVMPHRLVLAPEALLEGITQHGVTLRLIEQVAVPR